MVYSGTNGTYRVLRLASLRDRSASTRPWRWVRGSREPETEIAPPARAKKWSVNAYANSSYSTGIVACPKYSDIGLYQFLYQEPAPRPYVTQ